MQRFQAWKKLVEEKADEDPLLDFNLPLGRKGNCGTY